MVEVFYKTTMSMIKPLFNEYTSVQRPNILVVILVVDQGHWRLLLVTEVTLKRYRVDHVTVWRGVWEASISVSTSLPSTGLELKKYKNK